MEFLVIWLLFGLITGLVASQKGMRGCGWFLIRFLLDPFGLILSLVISGNKKTELPVGDEDVSERKKCPYCAEWIRAEAIKSRFCGLDLSAAQAEHHLEKMERPE